MPASRTVIGCENLTIPHLARIVIAPPERQKPSVPWSARNFQDPFRHQKEKEHLGWTWQNVAILRSVDNQAVLYIYYREYKIFVFVIASLYSI